MPEPPPKRGRGRPKVYADRLIVKALVIMVIRRVYSAYSLLAFLDRDTDLTRALRAELTDTQGRFPSRRTWERRLQALLDTLPGLVGCLRRYLGTLIQPEAHTGASLQPFRNRFSMAVAWVCTLTRRPSISSKTCTRSDPLRRISKMAS